MYVIIKVLFTISKAIASKVAIPLEQDQRFVWHGLCEMANSNKKIELVKIKLIRFIFIYTLTEMITEYEIF